MVFLKGKVIMKIAPKPQKSCSEKGVITLHRDKRNFVAGFSMLKEELSSLVEKKTLLHPLEYTFFETLNYERRQLSFLLGRLTAKEAIAQLIDPGDIRSILIDFGVFQFPVVRNCIPGNIQVCISHCDNIGIALAFPEEHPIGMVLEKIDPERINAIRKYVSVRELELISGCGLTISTGCTALWTMKESLSKIFRTGLTMDFSILEIQSLEAVNGIYSAIFRSVSQYKAISFHIRNHICSLVIPKNTAAKVDDFLNSLHTII